MNNPPRLSLFRLLFAVFVLSQSVLVNAVDFVVRTPNFQYAYQINGTDSPTLTLVRGRTYTFDVWADYVHPFHIEGPGVKNNDTYYGLISFTVPTNHANYFYNCTVHGDWMRGEIVTIDPPSPPRILNLTVGDDLVLTSTATNGGTIVPEFKPALDGTNWFALSVRTNRLANGVLETICGPPATNTAFIRLRTEDGPKGR